MIHRSNKGGQFSNRPATTTEEVARTLTLPKKGNQMSGGHFRYSQYTLSEIAEEIDSLIASNGDQSLNEFGDPRGRGYSRSTVAKFRETAHALRRCGEMLQRVDWLVSCDDGEETFHRRWKEEVREPNATS